MWPARSGSRASRSRSRTAGDRPVLRGIDLDIQPGETIALVGATGSGKSALITLVPRLYDVTAGRITIDGHDIRDLALDNLRELVGVAFEEPTLFSMSVRENLTLGRPDATDEQVAEALSIAQADFVYDLPWGLDTRVGEQGLSLSGGQRQRLALARAVLGRPRVLVLDDPLSALDVHTEALVEEALARVLTGSTALIVVHRPSTVALADRVALLQDGVITARRVPTPSCSPPSRRTGRCSPPRPSTTHGPRYPERIDDRPRGPADRHRHDQLRGTGQHQCQLISRPLPPTTGHRRTDTRVARHGHRGRRRPHRGRGTGREGRHPAARRQPGTARLAAAPAPAQHRRSCWRCCCCRAPPRWPARTW